MIIDMHAAVSVFGLQSSPSTLPDMHIKIKNQNQHQHHHQINSTQIKSK